MIIVIYYQIKTPIGFWYRQKLNFKYLIQLLETLPIKLIETHQFTLIIIGFGFIFRFLARD